MNLARLMTPFAVLVPAFMAIVIAQYEAPPVVTPDQKTLTAIGQRSRQLEEALRQLSKLDVHDPQLADIEIYLKAVRWELLHKEFYHKDAGAWTLEVLDRGLLRASQVRSRANAPGCNQTGIQRRSCLPLSSGRILAALRRHLPRRVRQGAAAQVACRRRAPWPRLRPDRGFLPAPP